MNGEVKLRTVYRWAVVAGLGLVTVGLAAAAIYAVRGVVVLAAVALFIAVSLDPAVRWLDRRGMSRGLAVTLIFTVVVLTIAGLVAAVVPPLVRQATNLSRDLPAYIDQITQQSAPLREFGERLGVTEKLRQLAVDVPGFIGTNVVSFVQELFGAVFTGLTVTVLTIYFMVDLPRLRTGVVRLFPPAGRVHARRTVNLVVDKVGAYMFGNVLISVVAGGATFALLSAVGAPFALPLAVVVAITDLIPMIGATLGAVVCLLVTAIAAPLWPTTVIVAVFFIVYQQVENYLIAPRILRNAVDLPAVAVLLAALVGGTVLGLIGALMAIPVAAVIKVLASPKIREMDAAEAPLNEVGRDGEPPDAARQPLDRVPGERVPVDPQTGLASDGVGPAEHSVPGRP